MGFLSSLGGIINNQFGIGENTSHSLDGVNGDIPRDPYERLGDFAKKIDQSAERTYIEDGFIRNIRPRTRGILFQQPDIFVVVKKRMFSTLADNSRLDLLEEKERILVKASKRLFQNKCRLISSYEKLTKIEQLTYESGRFNTFLGAPVLDLLNNVDGFFFNLNGKTKSAIDTLRKVLAYSEPGEYTNWSTNDNDAVFGNEIGEGPGTFELTNVASVKTSVSTKWGGGSASLTIEDPYNLLTITEKDIDQALTDVTNPMRVGSSFKFADIQLQNRIEEVKKELAIERRAREASQISFKVSPGTLLSKRVRAIVDNEGQEVIFEYSTANQDFLNSLENSTNVFEAHASVFNLFSTGSVQIDPQFLVGNPPTIISQNNQLTDSEREKFVEIIANIYTLLAQRATSKRELKNRNAEINYARNRMRQFFNGKYIIQPMDTITIWMTSRTGEDERIPGGFNAQQNQNGHGAMLGFDNLIKNINNQLTYMRDPSGSFSKTMSFDDIERLSVVGPNMPKWLWRQFRQDITGQPTGPCIFHGIVGKGGQGVSGSWSDGRWTVSVSCEDSTGYFDKSQINFKPSADVFNSSIYDPLTPFDVSFDAATGVPVNEIGTGQFPPLLKENQDLLLSGALTYKSGVNKGNPANINNWQNPSREISFNDFRAVLHNPDGLVYRWKQGIQTLTASSRPVSTTSIDQERSVLLTNRPFAGQDVMNVISILITAQPYNYGTFLKAAIANGNSIGNTDQATNISAASTYIQGLLSDIEKTNLTWGNFVPYKKLVINPAYDKFLMETRTEAIMLNTKIQQLLSERAKAEDELILQQGGFFVDAASAFRYDSQGRTIPNDPNSSFDAGGAASAIQTKIKSLSTSLSQALTEFELTINNPLFPNPDVGITMIGNDINADPSLTSIDNAKDNPGQKQRNELQLRQNLKRYTARRFWQVRANRDQNLLIVDDQYDKNYDIQAFERRIGSKMELFNTQYSTISSQLSGVAELLGLECFANTQGHIEVRPPGYNKVPSSVFFKMFQDRDENGTKVFPDFLESLYFNQIKNIFNQIEVVEDEIRLRAVALGARNDSDIISLIVNGNSQTPSSDSFSFLTTFDGDGRIGTRPLQQLFIQADPDFSEGWTDPALKELDEFETKISKLTKTALLFTPSVQANAIANFNPNVQPNTQEFIFDTIRSRLRIKTGKDPKKLNDLFGNRNFRRAPGGAVSSIDRINILNQISNMLGQRQTLLKSVVNAIRNLREGVGVNAPDIQNDSVFQGGLGNITKPSGSNKTSRALTTPSLYRKTEIPQFLEHMIEYEDEDDIGPNSGRRFILTADRIVSMTISENPPPFNAVTVKGLFGEGFVDPISGFQQTSEGGNGITSAYAVDYDSWYQYGFRIGKTIEAPYLSDPDTQCAPFAFAMLLQARENIIQGTAEVVGYNEFYQPGDVVYVEDKNLLFYVSDVSHSISYGKLSTTLSLTYGHSPGEYIPTMLDVVGKILYNSKGFSNQFRSVREQMQGSARSIGALTFVSNLTGTDGSRFPENSEPLELLLRGRYGNRNKQILSNILFGVSGSLNPVSFRRQRARIKIVYYKTSSSKTDEMNQLAYAVKDWLLYPEEQGADDLLPSDMSKDGVVKQKDFGLNESDIIIEEVDLSNPEKQTRQVMFPEESEPVRNEQGPSSSAIQVTKESVATDVTPGQFTTFLANTVLDVFIDYTFSQKELKSVDGQQNESQIRIGEDIALASKSRLEAINQ